MRAAAFDYEYAINKLGKPIDRDEWQITPQTINAYYDPQKNEIVFPAAILQPPFFDPAQTMRSTTAASARSSGTRSVMASMIRAASSMRDGNLRDWFCREDHEKFTAKTAAIALSTAPMSPFPAIVSTAHSRSARTSPTTPALRSPFGPISSRSAGVQPP